MNINTRQLHAFILVVEHGSFTKAAEHLHITQSGISALVKELESQLAFRLFDRTTRRVTLTEAGEHFYGVARSIDHTLRSGVREITNALAGQQRSLRVAASPVMVNGILPDVLTRHLNKYPDDRIELLDVSRSEVLPEVENGGAELGLGIFFRSISGLRLYRLFSSSLILISPPGWRSLPQQCTDDEIRIRDVPASGLIRLTQDNPFQHWVDDRLVAVNQGVPDVGRCMRFRNIESCIAMVEMGRGHFVAPDFVIPVCKRYDVSVRSICLDHEGVELYAVARAGAEPSPVLKDFLGSFLETAVANRIGGKHAESALATH